MSGRGALSGRRRTAAAEGDLKQTMGHGSLFAAGRLERNALPGAFGQECLFGSLDGGGRGRRAEAAAGVCARSGGGGRLVVPEVGVGEVGGNGACPGPQVVCFSVLRDGTAGLKLGTGDCWAAHPRDSRGVTKRQHVSSVPRISNRCRKGIAAQWRLILAVRIAASAHT